MSDPAGDRRDARGRMPGDARGRMPGDAVEGHAGGPPGGESGGSTDDLVSPRVLPASDPASIAAAVAALRAGRIVAVPTETVYGVACLLDAASIERLLDAKRRPASKGITLLVDDLAQAASVAALPPAAVRLGERYWPGPLTIVAPVRAGVAIPESLTGTSGAIGCRVPDHAVPRALARELGPIPLTSANLSGAPDARDAAEVVRQLGPAVSVVIDDGPSPGGVPSTVILFAESDAAPTMLRAGALPFEEILAAIR